MPNMYKLTYVILVLIKIYRFLLLTNSKKERPARLIGPDSSSHIAG